MDGVSDMDLTTSEEVDHENTGSNRVGQFQTWGRDMISFKDKLTNTKVQEQKREDFEIQEDVVVVLSGDFPTVSFSNKVHNYRSQAMKNFVIIRLLGRAIGNRPLLGRLQSLWRSTETLQLVDLENNYYLIKFSNSDDFMHTLTGGPWVIYIHYLIVQPWTSSFLVGED